MTLRGPSLSGALLSRGPCSAVLSWDGERKETQAVERQQLSGGKFSGRVTLLKASQRDSSRPPRRTRSTLETRRNRATTDCHVTSKLNGTFRFSTWTIVGGTPHRWGRVSLASAGSEVARMHGLGAGLQICSAGEQAVPSVRVPRGYG